MIGRASLWGLAANGQAGVENVLDLLRSGIESALLGLGHASIHDLTPDDLIIPAGVHPPPRPVSIRVGPPSPSRSNRTTPRMMVPAAWSS